MEINNFVLVEKYRPHKLADCILPKQLENTFKSLLSNKTFPNLILSGPPGIGKTSVARAILEDLGCDYIVINGSLNGNIDTLRNEIKNFASTISFQQSRKFVILDEADYLNPHTTQASLRNFMEEYSINCGFILTCNYLTRIIEPLRSRCSVVEFKITKEDKPKIAAAFFRRCREILDAENVRYDPQVVAALITKYFPDWRRVLNELQRYSITGEINSGILTNNNLDTRAILELLKKKNFEQLRTFVSENIENLPSIYEYLYEELHDACKANSIPDLILILAKYQYQSAFVASQEINIAACLSELMVTVEFK